MNNRLRPKDYDIIFLSYDEPNADKNYHDLLNKIPWAKRIHGVEGSDAAHKACAELSETDRFNEYLMTGLRKAEGISLDYMEPTFSEKLIKHLIDSAAPLLTQRKLVLKDEVLRIPETEWFTADTIISELFWVD